LLLSTGVEIHAAPARAADSPEESTTTGTTPLGPGEVGEGGLGIAERDSNLAAERPATPIVPEPAKRPHRAYQLYWEVDVPVLGVAAVLGAARMARTEGNAPAFCVQQIPEAERETRGCDPNELNFVDRPVAGRWSPFWSDVSDYLLLGLGAAPIAVLWIDEGFLNMLNDVVVIYQSTLIAAALSGLSSLSAGRGRPYVYGTKAPLSARTSSEGALAFFSGHSSMAFALSTSTFWTLKRTHLTGPLPWIALGVGTAGASGVALARVLGGRHFPTDVMAGAIVGLGIGTLIPMLHGIPVQVLPELTSDAAALSLAGAFY
jgi:membrane-associated phospholipid phosphatase